MRILYRFLSLLLTGVVVVPYPLGAQTPPASPGVAFQELHIAVAGDPAVTFTTGSVSEHAVSVEVTGPNGAPVPGVAVTFRLPGDGASGSFGDSGRVTFASTDSEGRATAPRIQWGLVPGTVALRITAAKGIAHAGLLVERTLAAAAVQSAPPPAVTPAVTPAAVPAASRPHVSIVNRTQPGTLAGPATAPAGADTASAAAESPARRPDVSVVNTPKDYASPHSSKKWLWIALLAGGAAGGAAFALTKGKAGTPASAAATPSLIVGTPSIGIGHP